MKHFSLFLVTLLAAVLPSTIWANTIEDHETGVMYTFEPGSGVCMVAEGDMYESDPRPQTRIFGNSIIAEDVVIRDEFTSASGERLEVTEIGFCAFACLTKIRTVTIPRTMRVINANCFAGCVGIRDIYCYANPNKLKWTPSNLSYAPDFKENKTTVCHVIKGYEEKYKQKFGNINVTFVGDINEDIEPEEENITSVFVGTNGVCNLLVADNSNRCWQMQKPNDGTDISYVTNGYGGEDALYFRVSGGSSSIKEFVLTSDFPVKGKMTRIVVRAAGGIHHLAYMKEDYTWVESGNVNMGGDYTNLELNFGAGIDVNGPVQFLLYSATPLVLQSVTIYLDNGGSEEFVSTFNGWFEEPATPGLDKNGIMTTIENRDWDGVVSEPEVSVEYTTIGASAGEGTSCIATYLQEGEYNLHMMNRFQYSGPVEKIIIRAAGNTLGLSASIGERSGGEWYHAGIPTNSSSDFVDYVITCPNCPIYDDASIQIQMHGEGVMFVHSITVVQKEVLEELPSGKCGDNLNWELVYVPGLTVRHQETYEDIPAMRLVITGSGAMYDFADEWSMGNDKAPWFEYKQNIISVDLPDALTYIGSNAFTRYWNISWLDPLPSSLTGVGSNAFYNDFIANELRLPEGVTSVAYSAFQSVNGVKDIYIPKSLTNIGNQAFVSMFNAEYFHVDADNPVYSGDGYGLIEKASNTILAGALYTEIPDYVTAIANYAFESTRKETINLPSSIQSIGYMSFYYALLKELIIPDNVTSIGQEAFASCKQLLTVTIGKGVKTISKAAFENSTNILDVYCYANPEELRWESYGYDDKDFMPDKMTRFHVYAKDLDKWKSKFDFLNVTFVGDLSDRINPIIEEKTIDVETLKTEDLTDNNIDNVYYNLDPNRGCGYINGSLVIGQTTDMSQIGNGEPGSTEVSENFNGIILKVNGKGTITIDASVFGSQICLAVRIGNGTPTYATEYKTTISYNVNKETYIYIYAVGVGALVNGRKAPEVGDNAVIIYGITVTPDASAIENIATDSEDADSPWYDLNGRRVALPTKGVFIRNGKRILVK